ncbi:SRPBCC family protein [Pseudooceanicola sp. C21-150M6]|uniref:SRPBCC family protein n=1 Tax=Pseudooceanicola sp. C21-150M6 TaxID=3434355 RepID=UPI003D7FA14B
MKFSTREDVSAPLESVFAQLTDFDHYEKMAMRRGAQVKRERQAGGLTGTVWDVSFAFRGKQRDLRLELVDIRENELMVFVGNTAGLTCTVEIELVAMSPKKTRVRLSADLKPQTLSARLMVQSMKLAKGNLDKRFSARVSDMAAEMGRRHAATA